MIHYHVWFSLRAQIAEDEGVGFARSFIEELRTEEMLARGWVLKNASEPPKTRLLRYHALFEFDDDKQMAAAFAAKRSAGGIHTGPHGRLMDAVSDFQVEIFRGL